MSALGLVCSMLLMTGFFREKAPVPLERRVTVPATGPLTRCSANPRYFCDGHQRPVLLTGSHTWNNFQDMDGEGFDRTFDYDAYLEFLRKNNHNFIRLWVWEQGWGAAERVGSLRFDPLPYPRTGPGKALDGGPRFDVAAFNGEFFQRLRSRVKQARDRGLYVSVMLFNGWSVDGKMMGRGNPWNGHPFNRANNINGVDGDPRGTGFGLETHSLRNKEITRLQEAYVRRVIDTVNDLDNVLWEVSNESPPGSEAWHRHFISFIKEYESGKPNSHPVGMTSIWPGGNNLDLTRSSADWISPNETRTTSYKNNPPAAAGQQVVVTDTDHLWGIGGTHRWVWKSFTRGLNPIFMDTYTMTGEPIDGIFHRYSFDAPQSVGLRSSLGYARALTEKIDLLSMAPRNDLSSTRYCLASPGKDYLVYQPEDGPFSVKLERGKYRAEWFDPLHGMRSTATVEVKEPGEFRFRVPAWISSDAVLHLARLR